MSTDVLVLKNVHKKIKGKTIINNLSFQVKEGEVYGFLGPNGSGKTTTIRLITGLIKLNGGQISICGHDITKQREKALSHIGGIVENPELYEYMTGRQNLKLFANMATPKVDNQRIEEMIQLVDLVEAIDQPVKNYSLGMKQRLGIAQALLHQPKLLILDEPTNGLDPAGIREMRDYFRYLAEKEKVTILVSSHLLSEIELMCDRILIIKNGDFIKEINLHETHQTENKIRVIVDNPDFALTLLEAKKVNNQCIEIDSEYGEIPNILMLLISQGVRVYEVTPQIKTLEDEFLEMTKGGLPSDV